MIVAAFDVALADSTNNWTQEELDKFKEWKSKFHKSYASEASEEEAMNRVLTKLRDIEEHNKSFHAGDVSFTRALGKFSDLKDEDKHKHFPMLHGNLKFDRNEPRSAIWTDYPNYPTGPASIDWNERGLIGPVLSQGSCGSCWAFCAVQLTEVVMRRKNITDIYSAQQLIDCDRSFNNGCYSGWPYKSLNYINANGIAKNSTYPYLGTDTEKCHYDNSTAAGHINQVFNVPTKGQLLNS